MAPEVGSTVKISVWRAGLRAAQRWGEADERWNLGDDDELAAGGEVHERGGVDDGDGNGGGREVAWQSVT